MRVTLGGRTVAHEGHRHRVFAEALGRHRRAHRVQPVRADLDAQGCAALIGERQSAVPGPAPHRTHLRGRDTAGQQGAEFAVLREQPVGLAQTRRRADLSGFLTAAGGVQGEFTLALQVDEFGVEFAGEDHLLVEPGQRFRR